MEEMLIINPRPGQFKKGGGRVKRRARRVNSRRRRVSARKRRRNPIAAVAAVNPRRRRRRNPIAAVAAVNPRRRRRRNPIALANPRRRRRHNPRGAGSLMAALRPRALLNSIIPAGIGAAGAIGLDIALAYVPLPAQFQTPLWKNVARVVGAIGLGYAASMVVGREKGRTVTMGALTVAAYGALKDVVQSNFPNIGLSGIETHDYSDLRLGYVNPAPMVTAGSGMGAYMQHSAPSSGVGAYMRSSLDNVNSLNGVTSDGM